VPLAGQVIDLAHALSRHHRPCGVLACAAATAAATVAATVAATSCTVFHTPF
jgi:hypothetical protein